MQQSCRQCQAGFEITDDDLAFLDKVSPVFNGKKEAIPAPTLCPECRLQRRLAFRNQIHVFSRTSSLSGKQIFSSWPEDVGFPVISNEEWWGDAWNGLSAGQTFDFGKSFHEQFHELRSQVPHIARSVSNLENSDYCVNAGELKNCYMVFNTTGGEDGMYCEMMNSSVNTLDCTMIVSSQLCCDCTLCENCYNLQSSQQCEHCSDSHFLLNCRSCKHCFGCVNLRHAEYCVFNEQKTKAEYDAFLRGLPASSHAWREDMRRKTQVFFQQHPRPNVILRQVEQCAGNIVLHSRNVQGSFFCSNDEDLTYCFGVHGSKDCRDYSVWGNKAELVYEAVSCGINAQRLLCCYEVHTNTSNMLYCQGCVGCRDCFGCVGLKKQHHCVFNKQYTKEEYEALVPTIIAHMRFRGEWGEFFPMTEAFGPYNYSLAQRYFPLTKSEAATQKLHWYDQQIPEAKQAVEVSSLPDGLPAQDDPIIVRSALSGRPFKITSEEIRRYRQFNVPLPRMTYDERMEERIRKLGGIHLYQRACAKTGQSILTTYPPDSPYIIWDRDVYEKEFGS
ncbi:MAG: Uncharacterized protein G01um101425_125 [Candidatus Peregrinibacteria bacterium Gr01-1014_25]|nr:MAG: Uncharacterized protein G01um101425_125 [Candidatus Peregrinibacteria bacterium Gr01-1014_25]